MLVFDAVHKAYGTKAVLRDFSLTVPEGTCFGFCGANGAGKTTAMRIALGMLPPDSGSVTFAGRPITADVRERIGYMPEERGLYGQMRPVDQLVYFAALSGVGRRTAKRRAVDLMDRMGVKYEPKDKVDELSLGNQQKVQLIAAVIHEPDILVLDEPFSGLDPVATDAMTDVLRRFTASGTPVLFSSHQLELVERVCDRVGIVSEGRMVAAGTVDELGGHGSAITVRVAGGRTSWAATLPTVAVTVDPVTDAVEVDLTAGVTVDEVLRAASSSGPVEHVSMSHRSLTEIFREAVS
ncbi:ABC transporter ATP-binding protein [Rhodococcoides corynebacterioides]|uniref:ABC transporter ATP-binding protein n=1 Tax=Rhodococcoides corynebacterioides TaxID=53972 RepID=UPI001C9B9754|nr:ATP-binding cassette domain-containing protein [Rhodococcus corynebacterioides]MBY6350955.1 ABC transporter ATP-binding protein [Rhodococcus corynebacterioides]